MNMHFISFIDDFSDQEVLLPLSEVKCFKKVEDYDYTQIFTNDNDWFEARLTLEEVKAKLTSLGAKIS